MARLGFELMNPGLKSGYKSDAIQTGVVADRCNRLRYVKFVDAPET